MLTHTHTGNLLRSEITHIKIQQNFPFYLKMWIVRSCYVSGILNSHLAHIDEALKLFCTRDVRNEDEDSWDFAVGGWTQWKGGAGELNALRDFVYVWTIARFRKSYCRWDE